MSFDRRTLLTQVAGWAVLNTIAFGRRVEHDITREGAPPTEAFVLFGLSIALGVLSTRALVFVYDRLPQGWFESRRMTLLSATLLLVPLVLLANVSSGILSSMWGGRPWQSPGFAETLANDGIKLYVLGLLAALYFHDAAQFAERLWKAREHALQSEAQTKAARLETLRARISPHFLFNSLNSAVALIDLAPDRAKAMLRDLSGLLRRSLQTSEQATTSLSEEVDFLMEYLRCEQIRFGSELHVRTRINEELLSVPVPSLLLHPLVENAVKHGLSGADQLSIELRAFSNGDQVRLEIANTGRLCFASPLGTRSGLQLVRERLTTLCPSTGDFGLEQRDGWVVAGVQYDPVELLAQASGGPRHA